MFAIVETEHLLINVTEQKKRLNGNVSTAKAALQQRPEVFQSVRMHAALDVLLRVVHNVMDEAIAQLVIAYCIIGVDGRTILNIVQNFILQSLALDVRNHSCADLSQVAVEHSLHDRLSSAHSALLNQTQLAALVHVLGQPADERFIGFHFRSRSAQLRGRPKCPVEQCRPKALQHKPCRFLRNAKRAVNLHAADAVLTIQKHPQRYHPLIHAKPRILKDRIDLERELAITATAEPHVAGLDEVVLVGTATRTMNLAIGPAQLNGVFEGAFRIGEVNNGLL